MCSHERKFEQVRQCVTKLLALGETSMQGLVDLLLENGIHQQYAAEVHVILLEVVRKGVEEKQLSVSCMSLSDTTMISMLK